MHKNFCRNITQKFICLTVEPNPLPSRRVYFAHSTAPTKTSTFYFLGPPTPILSYYIYFSHFLPFHSIDHRIWGRVRVRSFFAFLEEKNEYEEKKIRISSFSDFPIYFFVINFESLIEDITDFYFDPIKLKTRSLKFF